MRSLTVLICLLLAVSASLWAATPRLFQEEPIELPELPYFENSWRPNPTEVLATLDGEPISESDLMVHLVIEGEDASVVQDWQTASAERAPAQHQALRDAILSRARLRLLAEALAEKAETQPDDALLTKGARMRAYPAATLVYADVIARPTVEIQPLDIAYFYESNTSRYRNPDAVQVRELRVPIVQPTTEANRREARRRAGELRQVAMAGDGLLPLLTQYPQYRLLQDPDATQRLEVGSVALDPLIQEQLFQLTPGQISQPLPTSGAFSLFEVVQAERAQVAPINDVAGEITTELRQQILKVRTESLLTTMVREQYPVVYTDVYPYADDDSVIMNIGDFKATYGELRAIFPEMPVEVTPLQEQYDVPEGVREQLRELRHGELLTQQIEAAGLTGEFTYQAALKVGRERVLADIYRQSLLDAEEEQEPTDAEVLAWLEENREQLAPAMRRGVWELTIIPENWSELSTEQQREMEGELRGVLAETIRVAEQLLEERTAISGPRVLRDPASIVNRLLRNDPGRFRMTMENLGQKTDGEALKDLGQDISTFEELGKFGDVQARRNGALAAIYVGTEVEQIVPTDDQLIELARVEMIEDELFADIEEKLAQMEESGRLNIHLPEE